MKFKDIRLVANGESLLNDTSFEFFDTSVVAVAMLTGITGGAFAKRQRGDASDVLSVRDIRQSINPDLPTSLVFELPALF